MEHNGVPIDMEKFQPLADKYTWGAPLDKVSKILRLRDAMVPIIDAQYGVYVRNAAGDWTFNMALFGNYLKREGLLDFWPRRETGKLDMRRGA
jgi:hypothetical protein